VKKMPKMTKTQARRKIEEIHGKVNKLMASNYITTKDFLQFLQVIERSRNRLNK
jgi:hypothetical protein